MTVSVDNASSNNTTLGYLKNRFREDNKKIMGHECLHVRYVAHILNLVVTNGLKDVHNSVAKDIIAMRFVRSLLA